MYAVIECGGKKYRVEPGDVLEVERLAQLPADGGELLRFERVLMVAGHANPSSAPSATDPRSASDPVNAGGEAGTGGETSAGSAAAGGEESGSGSRLIGTPLVAGALVTASFLGEAKGPKIRVFKTKRRNTQRRTRGHRQHLHRIRIEEIQLPGGAPPSAARS